MTAWRCLACLLVLVAGPSLAWSQGADHAQETSRRWAPLLGWWEYRQQNVAAPGGRDPEGERLEMVLRAGTPRAFYFGLEREGEHGLFYTATEVTELSLAEDGRVSFVVPARRLFARRPGTLADAERTPQGAGFTKLALQFRGRLRGGRLELECAGSGCPATELAFDRLPVKVASPPSR